MFPVIQHFCDALLREFDDISLERKNQLNQLANYIQTQQSKQQESQLLFVCTHNSRRSQLGQVWASVAANFFGISHFSAFSAGTEVTSFHNHAIEVLRLEGFQIIETGAVSNPKYLIDFGASKSLNCYSKTIKEATDQLTNFAIALTCTDAAENCPFIPGAALRVSLPYEDPKIADGTSVAIQSYRKRSREIARDCLYLFSRIQQQ